MKLFNINKNETDIKQMSPLTWAYIGDAVYELYVRTYLVDTTHLKPNKLHIESIKYVKAKAQAEALKNIENILTEEEKEIVRRGRNTDLHHIAKNASVQEYIHATAFEALIGYLYLSKKEERLIKILKMIVK